ncbi:hypothetical protein IWX91DRAFT_328809 [Phyllosticta citricarpa]
MDSRRCVLGSPCCRRRGFSEVVFIDSRESAGARMFSTGAGTEACVTGSPSVDRPDGGGSNHSHARGQRIRCSVLFAHAYSLSTQGYINFSHTPTSLGTTLYIACVWCESVRFDRKSRTTLVGAAGSRRGYLDSTNPFASLCRNHPKANETKSKSLILVQSSTTTECSPQRSALRGCCFHAACCGRRRLFIPRRKGEKSSRTAQTRSAVLPFTGLTRWTGSSRTASQQGIASSMWAGSYMGSSRLRGI